MVKKKCLGVFNSKMSTIVDEDDANLTAMLGVFNSNMSTAVDCHDINTCFNSLNHNRRLNKDE